AHRRTPDMTHLRLANQQFPALLGIFFPPAATEHVVDAAAEVEEAILVLAEDVAGVQPSVGEFGARDLRRVVIAAADVGTADQKLTFIAVVALGVDQPELDLGRRHAGAAAWDRTAVDRRARRASGLGDAITFRVLDVR